MCKDNTNNMGSSISLFGLSDITDNKAIWRMLVAEFVGSLILVTVGCGSIISVKGDGDVNVIQVALTFGLVVATLVQALGHISGCHINPAVTLSMLATGEIKLLRALFYIVVQCIGAAAGSALLKNITPSAVNGNLGTTNLGVDISPMQGLLAETILTFLLLLVIHAVCDPRRKDLKSGAAFGIGLAITACHLSAIQYTGSSLNPARSFGPAVIMNEWSNHWIYWAGPIVGGIMAGIMYKFVFRMQKGESDSYDF